MILGELNPQDWDIATDAKPSEVMKVFGKKFRVIPTGIKHGTVTILCDQLSIEVTTFRVEGGYIDGRRPTEVRFVGDIGEDLSRRDLTINAIAYDPINDVLFDPFNGVDDIQAQIIKMVGDPKERLEEDGLRLIRIFRFVAQLGFEIDTKTLIAIPHHFDVFTKVAKERIHNELQKLLRGAFFQKSLLLLEECGLLYQLIPEFSGEEFSKKLTGTNLNRIELTMRIISELSPKSSLRLRFAVLIHQLTAIPTKSTKYFPRFKEKFIHDILKMMKFSNKQIADISHILAIHLFHLPYSIEAEDEFKDYFIRKFQFKVRPEYLKDYLMFYDAKEQALQKEILLSKELRADILQRAKDQPPIDLKDLAISGDDVIQYFQLKKKHASQREFIGLCLQIIRERVEDKPHINQKSELFNILENLNKIVSQCTIRVTRRVRIVSTDHIRKLYRNSTPEYVPWENEHTYLLAEWLILCLLRKDRFSIIIFDGTNFNLPAHPTHRELLGKRFEKYRPLFINANATDKEVELNLQAREREIPSIKKSDADLTVFRRYQKLLRTYPRAISTPNGCELIQISTRHTEFLELIQQIVKKIHQNKHRFIVMSGNVLSGKTYIAYILQKHLEGTTVSNT